MSIRLDLRRNGISDCQGNRGYGIGLMGDVKAILICGGLASSKLLVSMIRDRVSFIADVRIYPGEREMESLARGAFRALLGDEEVKIYG